MALSGTLTFKYSAEESQTAGLAVARATVEKLFNLSMPSGTGADQADRIFHANREITASANDDLDLAGVLAGALGGTLTFVKIKAIIIIAAAANVNNVVIGNAAAAQFVGPFGAATHTITLGPGDMFVITRRGAAGLAVTATTADTLRIANSGGGSSVFYDIIIIGTSA